jgi:hypothetical protein
MGDGRAVFAVCTSYEARVLAPGKERMAGSSDFRRAFAVREGTTKAAPEERTPGGGRAVARSRAQDRAIPSTGTTGTVKAHSRRLGVACSLDACYWRPEPGIQERPRLRTVVGSATPLLDARRARPRPATTPDAARRKRVRRGSRRGRGRWLGRSESQPDMGKRPCISHSAGGRGGWTVERKGRWEAHRAKLRLKGPGGGPGTSPVLACCPPAPRTHRYLRGTRIAAIAAAMPAGLAAAQNPE